MVREKIDGAWSLPGGWADVNTSVSESAIRECLEEAGAHVKPKRIIAIHQADRHYDFPYPYTIYKVFVECELIENNFAANTETLDSGFFPVIPFHYFQPKGIPLNRLNYVLKQKNIYYLKLFLIK